MKAKIAKFSRWATFVRHPALFLASLAGSVLVATAGYAQTASPPVPQGAGAEPVAATAPLVEKCRGLEGGQFQNLSGAPTWVVSSKFVQATAGQGAYCSVEGYVNPTVNFGVFLPAGHWNGKFLVRGCGGSCGSVVMDLACTRHMRDGYACLHTDMGHRSTLSDNNWTANNLQGLVDFGYRATHVTTLAGKAITEAYYGRAPAYSYFFACSTGGRQGMIEVQRFPEDFDGVIAIAPASMGPFGDGRPQNMPNPSVFNVDASGRQILPNRKALLIHNAVVAACDMDDGVRDGLIADPRTCRFQPSDLKCKDDAQARDCLTAAQVEVVDKIYNGRGALKGSEFNWIGVYLGNAPLPGEQSNQPGNLYQGRGDPIIVDTLNNPSYPDLRPFKARQGKLIMVHGWADQSVTPLPTIDYYETMTRTMGGADQTRDFARLFMVPGMDHCSGGEGAYAINYMGALEDWVERGKAPDALIGYHPTPDAPLDFFNVDLPRTDPRFLEFSRPHFAYPARAVYSGRGDPNQASSFVARR